MVDLRTFLIKVSKGKLPGSYRASTYEIADFMVKCVTDTVSMNHFGGELIGISSGPGLSYKKLMFIFVFFVTIFIFLLYYIGGLF